MILLEHLITSKTRIKLLLKFFAHPENKGYLREIAKEFNESTNSVRVELNRLTQAGLLETFDEGQTKIYSANTKHILFPEISSMVRKFLGIDVLAELIEGKIRAVGNIEVVAVTGDYAKGIEANEINIISVGEVFDNELLEKLTEKAKDLLKKDIIIKSVTLEEMNNVPDKLIVWSEK